MRYRRIALASILGATLITLSVLIYYFQAHLEIFSVFVRDPLWASVIVTIVLVVINIIYILETRQTIHEMEKARKAEFLPHVRTELSWLGPTFLVLKVTNFGKGPATNVKAKITFLPSNEERIWDEAILSPNESIRILLPEGNIEKACEKSAEITLKGEYKDMFGQIFKIDEAMKAREFIELVKQLPQILERDVTDEIQGIKKELQNVTTEMRQIRQELERQYVSQRKSK